MDHCFKKNILGYFLIFICGIFLGWFLFHSTTPVSIPEKVQSPKMSTWFCPSHPDIKNTNPGKCPICNSALISQSQYKKSVHLDDVHFLNTSNELVKIATTVVSKLSPVKEVILNGEVQAKELVVQKQVATISGRVEKMMVKETGVKVKKDQLLALIYSPEFVAAQQELFEASHRIHSDPESFETAKSQLLKFGLNESQVQSMIKKDRVEINTKIVSQFSGVIAAISANEGEYINKGEIICQMTDLSRIWVNFDISKRDLTFLKKGDLIAFTSKAIPGIKFEGKIQFINPDVDPQKGLSRLRVEFDKNANVLRPKMQVTGIVQANLAKYSNKTVVPQTAVLWSDTRSFVYVKELTETETVFKPKCVTLGPQINDCYIIIDGLSEGDEITLKGASDLRKS